mgnify:CR=1 FL=1
MNNNRNSQVRSYLWVVQIYNPERKLWIDFTQPIEFKRAFAVEEKLAQMPGRKVRLARKVL